MAETTIAKNKLSEFLAALCADCTVYAPTADGDVITFRPLSSPEALALDYRISTVPPKELFLPQTQTVYEFDGKGFAEDALQTEQQVLFGARPCDCRALTLLDSVFDTKEVQDPFYAARRANTVTVAMACDRPLSTCFCTATGGDPFGEDGVDVLLADTGDTLLAKTATPKGKDFLARYDKFFSGSATSDWAQQAGQARDKIKANVDVANAKAHLDTLFENDVWETISQKCLGCGTCSFLCPTCYCFDLVDDKTPTGVRKISRWDCCMFSSFTLHASGHNPRAVNAARLRQKIMHKFCYYPERYGVSGCVGCGRCIRSCPVNLDIRPVLETLMATPAGTEE